MDTNKLLTRGVEEVIVKEHLEQALKSGKKLRVKFGIDPTAPDLHLGHTVPLRKLRQFQDAGHKAVLIIGDFTAMIGDPSGRSEARKTLTKKEVKQNFKKYLKLAGKIVDLKKAEIHYNGKWLDKKHIELELMSRESVQRVLERDDFQKRLKAGQEVSLLEILYPLMQGYDSVMVRADVEIGGTDQKFNLLMGRRLQRSYNQPEQDVVTLPLLEGTDGVKKMSKSAGNYIALDAEPADMFGKIMSVPDALIDKYYTLLTDSERKISDPREAKLELGRIIVGMYHSAKAGDKAKEEFIRVFSQGGRPEGVAKRADLAGKTIIDAIVEAGIAPSKSEARRLVQGRAVKVNGEAAKDPNQTLPSGAEVQVGKRHFFDT